MSAEASTPPLTDDELADSQHLLRRDRRAGSDERASTEPPAIDRGRRKWSEASSAKPRAREATRRAAEKISVAAVVVHLLKGNIGPGAMSLPNGFSKTGIYAGPALFVLVALVSVYNMDLLLECKRLVSPNKPLSFGEVGRAILGKRGKTLIDVFLVGTQLGICCVYFTFVATNIHAVLPKDFQDAINERQLIFAVFPVLLLLSWVRTLQRITPFSGLANGAVLLGITIVFYFSIKYWHDHPEVDAVHPQATRFDWRALPEFYGTAVYSFEGIGLILPIQNEMREPERFPRILAACMLAILVLFLFLGEIPTIAFGRITNGSMTAVLRDYCDGWLVPAANLLLAFACLLSFPIQFYPAIEVLERALNRHGTLMRPPRDSSRPHHHNMSSSSLSSAAASHRSNHRQEQHHHHHHHRNHNAAETPPADVKVVCDSDSDSSQVRISLATLQRMRFQQPPPSQSGDSVDGSTSRIENQQSLPRPATSLVCSMSQYECNRTIFRSMLCTSLMVVAVCVPDVGLLISLFGSVGSSMLAIVLPPLLYIESHSRTLPTASMAFHLSIALFGIIGMVCGTAQTLVQVVQSL